MQTRLRVYNARTQRGSPNLIHGVKNALPSQACGAKFVLVLCTGTQTRLEISRASSEDLEETSLVVEMLKEQPAICLRVVGKKGRHLQGG